MILSPESSIAACDIQYAVVSMGGCQSLPVCVDMRMYKPCDIQHCICSGEHSTNTHVSTNTKGLEMSRASACILTVNDMQCLKDGCDFAYQDGVAKTGLCLKKYFDTSHLSLSIEPKPDISTFL